MNVPTFPVYLTDSYTILYPAELDEELFRDMLVTHYREKYCKRHTFRWERKDRLRLKVNTVRHYPSSQMMNRRVKYNLPMVTSLNKTRLGIRLV